MPRRNTLVNLFQHPGLPGIFVLCPLRKRPLSTSSPDCRPAIDGALRPHYKMPRLQRQRLQMPAPQEQQQINRLVAKVEAKTSLHIQVIAIAGPAFAAKTGTSQKSPRRNSRSRARENLRGRVVVKLPLDLQVEAVGWWESRMLSRGWSARD